MLHLDTPLKQQCVGDSEGAEPTDPSLSATLPPTRTTQQLSGTRANDTHLRQLFSDQRRPRTASGMSKHGSTATAAGRPGEPLLRSIYGTAGHQVDKCLP